MKIRPLVPLFALALALLSSAPHSPAAPGSTITDDFSRYRDGGDACAAWDSGSVGWDVRKGIFESDGVGRSQAIPLAAPHARRLVVEATVTLRKASGTDWKIAGLAVVRDGRHYWHFAVVEQPDEQGKAHFVELTEMYAGKWLAQNEGQTRLRATAAIGNNWAWEYGRPYRFRLEVTREGIEGTIREMDGAERARLGFAFDNALAVTAGRPALTTGSLAAGFDDFKATVLEAAPAPPKPARPPYVSPGSGPARGKATGFFRVERIGGRWWAIDPKGDSLYLVGTDHVNYNAHWCEKLGYAPYHRNLEAKFGSEEKWAASAAERLKAWGFNTLGAGASESVRYRGLVHTHFLSFGAGFSPIADIAPKVHWTGFPDVFDPRFPAFCDRIARRQCSPQRDDPWLLGYFLDNELEWFGKAGGDTGLVDDTLKKPADYPAKRALVDFLRRRYPTIDALNRAWGTSIAGFEALARSTGPVAATTKAARKDRLDFVRLIADRYFAITTAAIRKVDPNHMIIGCRFAGAAPPIWDIAGKYLDIVTVNYYGHVDLERGVTTDMPQAMAEYYRQAKRPLMLTEWSFPALDAGLPCKHGAGQRVPTQKEKARCYAIYQKALFSMPFMVGSDYFMWVDEPALGISSTFPEDSNYGLVDVNDDAWPELTQTAARVNRLACALHSGQTAELSGSIERLRYGNRGGMLTVRNRGKVAAEFGVRLWVQGEERRVAVKLSPGGHHHIRFPLTGPSFVLAEIDPEDAVLETEETDNRVEATLLGERFRGPAVVVANPSGEVLRDVPLAVPLGRLGEKWQVTDAAGKSVPAQLDLLPGGAELAVRVPDVPARSVVVLLLKRGNSPESRREAGPDRAIALPGPLRLEHDAGSGSLFDRVLLGDLPLGRYTVLVHQATGQNLWVQPDRVEQVEAYTGPVRSVLLMTAALGAPEKSAAKTAVDTAGTYARQERRPHAYRMTFRITRYEGEAWFASRFLRVENTDTQPWHCRSYFHYPLSFIGGRAEDDAAATAGRAHLWRDAGAGAVYGAVIDTDKMRAHFWKDSDDGPGEHPDIWRELKAELKPGAAIAATGDDPEVLFFGARSAEGRPGGDALERLHALARLSVSVVR